MNTCRSKQLVEFFRLGFGIHHAGLVRHDRILMEKVFSAGHINVSQIIAFTYISQIG